MARPRHAALAAGAQPGARRVPGRRARRAGAGRRWAGRRRADALYAAYHLTCHQWAFRSFFLFGQQPSTASSSWPTWASTRSASSASQGLGWKMAFCERDLAIYVGLLLVGLLYARRRDLRPAGFLVYGVLILPMAVDGFTQLFGWRESTWELRVATGLLFGLASAWLVLPRLDAVIRTASQRSGGMLRTPHANHCPPPRVAGERRARPPRLGARPGQPGVRAAAAAAGHRHQPARPGDRSRPACCAGFGTTRWPRPRAWTTPQLERIADAFVAYFQGPPGQIQMQVTAFGQPRLLFNDRKWRTWRTCRPSSSGSCACSSSPPRSSWCASRRSPWLRPRHARPSGATCCGAPGSMVALVVLVGVAVADGLRRPLDAVSPDRLSERSVAARSRHATT